MEQKTVENLIIVLLVIAILYLLYKRENFDGSENVTNIKTQSEQELKVVQPEHIPDNESVQTKFKSAVDIDGFDRQADFETVDKFIKEYKDYSRMEKPIEQITSDEERNAYRSSFFDFRNYTNVSSHGSDPVDEINLQKLAEKNSKGLKVSDVYDMVSATNYKSSNVDIIGMQHNEVKDGRVVVNRFEYDNDTVSNGGFFFGKVTGVECGHDSPAAL